MNWSAVNDGLVELVTVATRAGLPFVAQQLHAVPRVGDPDSFMVLYQRLDTVRTLLTLNPPKQTPPVRSFLTKFSNLATVVAVIEKNLRS